LNVVFKTITSPESLEHRFPTVDRFREEATMTTAHSVPSLSFGRKGSRHSPSESAWRQAEPSSRMSPSEMTCTPWEGLYIPSAGADSSLEETIPNPELERFLMSLMSGE
jgi:hypothetical protein